MPFTEKEVKAKGTVIKPSQVSEILQNRNVRIYTIEKLLDGTKTVKEVKSGKDFKTCKVNADNWWNSTKNGEVASCPFYVINNESGKFSAKLDHETIVNTGRLIDDEQALSILNNKNTSVWAVKYWNPEKYAREIKSDHDFNEINKGWIAEFPKFWDYYSVPEILGSTTDSVDQ